MRLSVAVNRGRITLDGTVDSNDDRALVERFVACVPGSVEVINQLHAVTELHP